MKCKVCKSQMNLLENISSCRAESLKILPFHFSYSQDEIPLYCCPNCTHMQIPNKIDKTYYDQYEDNTGYSQYFGKLQLFEERLNRLRKLARNGESFIDIGCGSGGFLDLARNYFKNCTGIEPSRVGCEIAKKKGLDVINSYFNKSINLKNIIAFSAMQVFEHIENPQDVLKDLFETLDEGGVGLINVPNGQLILENNYYHQIIMEHLNYYTPFSLSALAHNAGFDIVQIESVDSLIEIDMYIKKPENKKSITETRLKHKEKLNCLLNKKEKITIWGAGPKASAFADLLNLGLPIVHLIDSDINKAGKYIGGITLPVEPVSEVIISKSDTIVIFAPSYNNIIMEKLKNVYHYKGTVIYIEKDDIKEEFFA